MVLNGDNLYCYEVLKVNHSFVVEQRTQHRAIFECGKHIGTFPTEKDAFIAMFEASNLPVPTELLEDTDA